MKKLLRFLFLSAFLAFFLSFFSLTIRAQNDVCNQDPKNIPENQLSVCIDELSKAMNQSKTATQGVQKQIDGIKARVIFIENDLVVKQKNIDDNYKNLAKLEEILNRTIRDFYIKSYYNSPLVAFLSASSASEITQLLAYQKAATDQDKVIITNIALSIQDLEVKKKNLKIERSNLAIVKDKLDKVVADAKAYQTTLSSKIASLTAQQQEIISKRLADLGIPRSAGTGARACVDDRDKDPGFAPRIAFFTYGVPNRTGLNQYGAQGRANAGQRAEQILSINYANYELNKDYDTAITINVEGYGGYNVEDYVKRIYEMPNSFHSEALKAQAIAARSYALSYTNNGAGSICTTEKCQVFKPEPKGGSWEQAVNDTKGWVMVQGGSPVKAWYSSTHGGYILSTSELPGWSDTSWTKHATDTTTGTVSGFGDLNANAYDRDSPWFYCDWGGRGQNNTAWLKSEEVADIANVILLVRKDSSKKCFVYQPDKSPPPPDPNKGCPTTDNWSADRVRQELGGEAIFTANSVDVTGIDWASGKTTQIKINGIDFDGNEFKNYFNLRAPANIQIVGPLYNVERK